MPKCTVRCDACAGLVEGSISHYDGVTGGFYLRGWVPVANKGKQTDLFPGGKNIVCDYCMQSSDAYQSLYGINFAERNAQMRPPLERAPVRELREDEVLRSYDDLRAYIRNGQWS